MNGLYSKLIFGKIDFSDIEGQNENNITWFPVVYKNFWALELTNIFVRIIVKLFIIYLFYLQLGNKSMELCNKEN